MLRARTKYLPGSNHDGVQTTRYASQNNLFGL